MAEKQEGRQQEGGAQELARPEGQVPSAGERGRYPFTPFEEMERMMDRLMGPWGGLPTRWEWPSLGRMDARLERQFPRVDVVDREDELLVRAELPGVEKDKLEVSVEEGSVTIKGSSEREEKEERGDYYRCEIARGTFSRTLSLPSPVDSDKAKATFRNGILELTLPKLEMAKRRSVKVE